MTKDSSAKELFKSKAQRKATLAEELDASSKKKNQRVLIVEDMSEMRSMLKALITSLGYTNIDTESSGSAALKLILSKHYDIVLSDFNLGGTVSGQQILEVTRKTYALDHSTIFIMVTADVAYENVVSILEFQPDSYLVKPFTPVIFKKRFEKVKKQKEIFDKINDSRKKQDFVAMEKQAKEIMLEYPNFNNLCLKIIGESLFNRGRYTEAKSHYVSVTKKHQKLAWAHHGIALCEIKLGNPQAAIESLTTTTELSRHFLSAYDLLAEAQEQLGEYEAAQAVMIEVIKISPYSLERAENLGRLSIYMRDWENAEQAYSRAIRLSRDTSEEKIERYYNHLQCITNLIESGDQSPKLADKFKRSLIRLRNIGKDKPLVITNSFRAEINQHLTRGYRDEAIKSWKQWNILIEKGYASPISEAQEKVIHNRLGLL